MCAGSTRRRAWCLALCALLGLHPLPSGLLGRLPDILNVAMSVIAEAWPEAAEADLESAAAAGMADEDVSDRAGSRVRARLTAVDAAVLAAVAEAGADALARVDIVGAVRASVALLASRVGASAVEGALAGVEGPTRDQMWSTFF